MRFRNLDTLIYSRQIKRSDIAELLGITPKTLRKKIYGTTPFTWPEVCVLREKVFPDISIDELFAEDGHSEKRDDLIHDHDEAV